MSWQAAETGPAVARGADPDAEVDRDPTVPVAVLGADAAAPAPAITPAPTGVVAFVGRCLKGPVQVPVRIGSLQQFQHVFGGLWKPSTLAYAVEQFFDNGGKEAVIVRVASGGRPPTLDLDAGGGTLTLAGLSPGSREYLRASVDHDGVEGDPKLFNLVVQRLRMPRSELVEEQEIFRRLSTDPSSPRHVAAVLAASRLVRVSGDVPSARPEITRADDARRVVGYASCNADGDDGEALSDYDVIGSESARTGLFALEDGPAFNFLCIPPLAHDRDVGMSVLLVAARFCRRRNALLLVDPPLAWTSTAAALDGLSRWPLHSLDAVMFFPRVLAFDRLRGRIEPFAPAAVAAALLTQGDRQRARWWGGPRGDNVLRSGSRPAVEPTPAERQLLAAHGVNTLVTARAAGAVLPACTLARELSTPGAGRLLAGRRLALYVRASIEHDTRWVVFEQHTPRLRLRVGEQVRAFLEGLAAEGAFGSPAPECFVICDDRVNGPVGVASGEFRLVYGHVEPRSGECHAVLVTHRPAGSESRAVSVNRLEAAGERVRREMESTLPAAVAARS